MSAFDNYCIKTTGDSKLNYKNSCFVNISDCIIEYNVFDTDKSEVESNSYEHTNVEEDIVSNFAELINIS